jgi:hypothetical protein
VPERDKHKSMIKQIENTRSAVAIRPAEQHRITSIGFTNATNPFSTYAFVKSPLPAHDDAVATVSSAALNHVRGELLEKLAINEAIAGVHNGRREFRLEHAKIALAIAAAFLT